MNYWTAWTILGFVLFFANWRWQVHSQEMNRAVKGTIGYAVARAKARKWRWLGFSFWFAVVPSWASITMTLVLNAPAFLLLWVPLMLCAFYAIRLEYRVLRQQIADDDDDWTQVSKRKLRRIAKAAVPKPAVPLIHTR